MRKLLYVLFFMLAFTGSANAQIFGNPILSVHSAAAESGHVLKASDGFLYGFSVTTGDTSGYVLIFNSTTVPADGAVLPFYCYSVPSASSLAISWEGYPVPFSNGISIAFSTTGCFTKTASATAFFSAQIK